MARGVVSSAMWWLLACSLLPLAADAAFVTTPPLRCANLPASRSRPAIVARAGKSSYTLPGLDGGDLWAGARASTEEVRELASAAMSTTISAPVMAQFNPARSWLWRAWQGTIVQAVLPREVLGNALMALLVSSVWPQAEFAGVEKVWLYSSSIISFTLSFFLGQSYTLWRNVYSKSRGIQGRLNDVGLLCATAAERNASAVYTDDAEDLLKTVARYVRLFHVLFYASCTRRFAPLATPTGLDELVKEGALTESEKDILLQSSCDHNAVLEWLTILVNTALKDGRLVNDGASRTGRLLNAKLVELRATYASISDELSGRMPLAYPQLMQLITDLLVFFTPFALLRSTRTRIGCVLGSALVTLFHSSILNLGKMFLDPFNNEEYGGKFGISICVDTLLQEVNLGSVRWSRGGRSVPKGVVAHREEVSGKVAPVRLAV